MNAPPLEPLSDTDLEHLDTLLETFAVPRDGMSLEMLDGFLSALVVGPELVMPNEYLPLVWNGEPEWASISEAEQAMRLVMGLWNDIVGRLQVPLEDENDVDSHAAAMPLLAYPALAPGVGADSGAATDGAAGDDDAVDPFAGAPSDFPLGAAWALGFLRGVGMRQAAWERWASQHPDVEDDLGMLETLALFSVEQAEELGVDPDDIPDLSERLELVTDLPMLLQDFNALRMQAMVARPSRPVRRAEQAGRNDACPCGSGKKFKKCCGAAQSLH
jgi:uncharacterized protein